jgi:FtsX-like permease family
MGRILLVARLAVRDLRLRRIEAALLLLAILAATTTLTLALVLRDAAGHPYQSTREATNGPDVTVTVTGAAGSSDLAKLAGDPEVVAHSGPYPVAGAKLQAPGRTSDVEVIGRDTAAASVDQPKVTSGKWVSGGGVVMEAAFANALGVHVGDAVTLAGRSFTVVGIAVSAASAPYPGTDCFVAGGCALGAGVAELAKLPPGLLQNPGLVWLTQADVRGLVADPSSLSYEMYLKLADPNRAQAFVAAKLSSSPQDAIPAHGPQGRRLTSWNEILAEATELAGDSQIILMIGAWLLGLLAVASLAVLVGGRMADQTRRVGLLKAVGGTPGLVAAVLLAEYLLVALVADAAGLAIGSLAAPLLTDSSAGLIGGAGTPSMTIATIGWVTAAALGVAVLATLVPALRAARSSTVNALADAPRPPRRVGWLIAVSARLPVPLLLALRVAARRPRRVVLGVVSIAITVSGIRRVGPQRLPRHRAGQRTVRRGPGPVAAPRSGGLDGVPAGSRGGQRDRHHLGDGARQPALLGPGPCPRRQPPGHDYGPCRHAGAARARRRGAGYPGRVRVAQRNHQDHRREQRPGHAPIGVAVDRRGAGNGGRGGRADRHTGSDRQPASGQRDPAGRVRVRSGAATSGVGAAGSLSTIARDRSASLPMLREQLARRTGLAGPGPP